MYVDGTMYYTADDIRKLQMVKQAMDDWKEVQNANHTMGT